MKKLTFLTFLFSLSNYANTDLTIDAKCDYRTKKEEMIDTQSFASFTITTKGKNSKYLAMDFSRDSNNGILISLNHTGNICAGVDCEGSRGKMYTISMVRVENDTQSALNIQKQQKASGKTSSTIVISKYNYSGFNTAMVDKGGKISYGKNKAAETLSLDYTVSNQQIEFNCNFDIL